ncbi:CHRD domain-containing protein [Rhodovastum atsumiense]|uniref:CHRD domain-containing protein n=1 Tax=Rhodovastum atsumiense TaxID=504468 RepID=A0A5M6IMI2_9PROT|nr:CHRD domain-containing protein [Rhodovastum atsumiense]KAA5609471.1 CHRD domain-containing protein [Rhodovastum atsumiense]CAH2603557.1 CHRD domain-containing protein [Rhodovastum atsumiense]
MPQPKLLAAAIAATLLCAGAQAETIRFNTTMNGQAEVPPKAGSGAGTVQATLDTATHRLDYTATWSGLSGPATAAHFHGPAGPEANAGVVVPWGANPTSPFTGNATLTEPQQADLLAGRWYANVHTAQNPAGEIRGQMTRQ